MFIFFDWRKNEYVVSNVKPQKVEVVDFCGMTGAKLDIIGFASNSEEEIIGRFQPRRCGFNEVGMNRACLVEIKEGCTERDEFHYLRGEKLFYSWVETKTRFSETTKSIEVVSRTRRITEQGVLLLS